MNEINFLPQSYRARLNDRLRRIREAAVVVICVFALVAYWAYGLSDGMSLRRSAERAEEQLAGALSRESQVGLLREQKKVLGEARRVQRELRVPIRHFEVINLLGELMPESVALTEMTLENKRPQPKAYVDPNAPKKHRGQPAFQGVALAKKAEPDVMGVTLEGLAPDDLSVAELIAEMSASPLFYGVKLRSSRFMDTRGVAARHFRISAQIDLSRDYVMTDPTGPLVEVNHEDHP